MKKMPPLTTADVAFLLCTSQQQHHPNTPRRDRPVTLETDYGLLIRLLPDGSVSAGLATPPIPPRSAIDEILHTPLTPSPGFFLLDPPPPSSFFSQPPPQTQPQPKPRQRPPPPPPPPAQQFKYLLAPSLHDPGASYLWYAGGWPGNPVPPPPPHLPPAPPSNPGSRRRIRHTAGGPSPPPHPVPEATLATRYHPSWFDGYLDWAERLEGSGSFGQMDEGERVLWTVEGLLLACWLSLQGDVAGVEYRPEGAEAEGGGRVLRGVGLE
ncbi:hypothetical protein B0T18DRAFT_432838 [Schizothecium vesticola]|uniref:Uncharacterized protein n=1 Tax=Schizothecium vesticola TaxID=314040 RepID=A0AA40EGS2_9PEZI|nr:hypothetical protein B0T18DRAFT_432838 [Schizothecium vesticola]